MLPDIRGHYTANKPLADLTTIKVGGPAQWWADFADIEDLQQFLRHKPADLPLTIIGEGSNVVIKDAGIAGVVTSFSQIAAHVRTEGTVLHAQAGATCGKAARAAREAGLAGLAFYAGIPGSIGGALRMNAGCYGVETADHLVSADVLTPTGEMRTLTPSEIGYGYRHCKLPPDWLFISATYQLKPGSKDDIRAEMRRINKERRESQPLKHRSSGSWFKNPVVHGVKKSAWRCVDEVGCRGLRVGDAQVSEKHSNFFINLGQATATDLLTLSEQVEAAVYQKLGIQLEREARFI